MEIPKNYDSQAAEVKWYSYWMEHKMFKSTPDSREPYTIVIPPPNVTGVLHMGHMLNNTIQDVLIRKARMEGKNACWVPGTDHASIATEAKVVAKLRDEGIDKNNLSRDEFMKHAWEWKDKHGGIILEQLKKLGASCDWDRTKFTMDDDLSESVINVFIDLFEKGKIYRGVRMINWDSTAQTALSDEEVIHKEVNSKLYYIRYKIIDTEDEWVTIATTRPETILGDTAVCVHPKDERYAHLKGKKVSVPLVNRAVPLIFDEYVDKDFGTGALKITPAHDVNDYNIGIKHDLKSINILNDDGTLSNEAELFVGQDRFEVRKEIEKQLYDSGYLVKTEDILNQVGYSERTDTVIEPKLSLQWFFKMDETAKPALDNVLNQNINFFPSKFVNSYKHWMENVHDWCISRQLWWGQRIPAYYYGTGAMDYVVAKTEIEALAKAKTAAKNDNLTINDLRQDEDVLDTWFSSWLWPLSVFDGIRNPNNEEINYYYPTNDIVTAPEILFFWVARMIMAGYEYTGKKPFSNVYLTGIVRDKLGRKMSKSLGNSPDPVELMQKHGADGVRIGMLLCSPAGNDLPFDEQLCEQGRNFTNKIWNAFRLIKSMEVHEKIEQPQVAKDAINWFEEKYNETLTLIESNYEKYRMSDVLMSIYKLIWDDFCSWYLELIKPAYQSPIDKSTYDTTINSLERLLQLLHPFAPFITEELWHLIKNREEQDCIMLSQIDKAKPYNAELLNAFENVQAIVTEIRSFRKSKNVPQKDTLRMMSKQNIAQNNPFDAVIIKLGNLSEFIYVDKKVEGSYIFMNKTNEFFIPISEDIIDVEAEKKKIKEELTYLKGFLNSVQKKLSNTKFVDNAPESVVIAERKKQSDAEAKITVLKNQFTEMEKTA